MLSTTAAFSLYLFVPPIRPFKSRNYPLTNKKQRYLTVAFYKPLGPEPRRRKPFFGSFAPLRSKAPPFGLRLLFPLKRIVALRGPLLRHACFLTKRRYQFCRSKQKATVFNRCFLFGGGAGSRTPVQPAVGGDFYMLIRRLGVSHFGTAASLGSTSP